MRACSRNAQLRRGCLTADNQRTCQSPPAACCPLCLLNLGPAMVSKHCSMPCYRALTMQAANKGQQCAADLLWAPLPCNGCAISFRQDLP